VERTTGGTLDAYLGEHVFVPLGMTTSASVDESKGPVDGAATRYVTGMDGKDQPQPLPWDQQGAAGIYSSVLDLLRWGANFWSGIVGGDSFLRAQLEGGRQPVPLSPTPGRYAAGVVLSTYRDRPLIWHTGAQPGSVSALILDREHRRSVALLCNTGTIPNQFFLAVNALDAWFGL
jgi:CubicO group peptidase (beta-lactamase class C family)